MNSYLTDKLARALAGTNPGQHGAQTVHDVRTLRGSHPTHGSVAVGQAAASGQSYVSSNSLNKLRADQTMGKAFCFGVYGFGWGSGEF